MSDFKIRLFEGLCRTLDSIEENYGAIPSPQRPFVAQDASKETIEREVETYRDVEDENENSGDESGKIANLNDRFRQSYPTPDAEIKGEWLFDEDITKLGSKVEANIAKKISRVGDDGSFQDWPLRDHGAFEHNRRRVIWQIKTFADDKLQADAPDPSDTKNSYRLMLVSFSDESE